MAKTPHLGLHQWESQDSFLRQDFNEDFLKIDNAIREMKVMAETIPGELNLIKNAIPIEKLTSTQLSAIGPQMELNLQNIDWSRYAKVEIAWEVLGSTPNNLGFRVNNNANNLYHWVASQSTSPQTTMNYIHLGSTGPRELGNACGGLITLFPTGNYIGLTVQTVAREYGVYITGSISACSFSALKSIQFLSMSDLQFLAGSRAVVYGIKR